MTPPFAVLAALLIVAVYSVFGVRAGALGVNVATVFSAFIETVPGTSFPVDSLSVNVSSIPAGDETIVAGSMG